MMFRSFLYIYNIILCFQVIGSLFKCKYFLLFLFFVVFIFISIILDYIQKQILYIYYEKHHLFCLDIVYANYKSR